MGQSGTEGSVIQTSRAPAALGPYVQARRLGDSLWCSGQLGLDPATGELRPGIAAQARQALDNLAAVIDAAGFTVGDIQKTTIFLADMADFPVVNRVYEDFFRGRQAEGAGELVYPARSTVQVAALPKGGLVEIEAILSR